MKSAAGREVASILPPMARVGADTLTASFLAGRNVQTLQAYQRDLEDYRAFLSAPTVDAAVRMLLEASQGDANAIAHAYRTHLVERGLQAATVNRRLAALRSLVKLANTVGLVSWRLSVESMKSQSYRDTRGPGLDTYRGMLAAAASRRPGKAARDTAILRLLQDVGLRRGELVRLDLADVDLERNAIMVTGKARTQAAPISLPAPTTAALAGWIADRGTEAGPLFTNLDRARKGSGRLTGAAVYQIISGLGGEAGATVRPHGLRHLAITRALDAFKGDVRKVAQFSRHKDIRVLTAYDDNRRDAAGEIAAALATLAMET
jgi:integrase/recombinase XerC